MNCQWAFRSAHVRMQLASMSRLSQSATRLVAQVGCQPMESAEKVVSSERSGWCPRRSSRFELFVRTVVLPPVSLVSRHYNPRDMGKGVESNSSKSRNVQSTFTCEDCVLRYSTYPISSSELMDLLGSCCRRSGSWCVLLGFRSNLSQVPG